MIGLIVFLAGFRYLSTKNRPDIEWMATLTFAVGILLVAIELVGDGLQAGAALDTTANADPSAIRGLMEASFPFYGAIGLILTALLLTSTGIVVLTSGVLHRWTGWTAFTAAGLCLLVAPSILGGSISRDFIPPRATHLFWVKLLYSSGFSQRAFRCSQSGRILTTRRDHQNLMGQIYNSDQDGEVATRRQTDSR